HLESVILESGIGCVSRPQRCGRGTVWNLESWYLESPMDTYLVAYDIANPKRLRKVARNCEDFGLRRQFSVFLCRLAATDLVRLKSRLYDIINLDYDQVLFIPLCARCATEIEALGRPIESHDARDIVIIS